MELEIEAPWVQALKVRGLFHSFEKTISREGKRLSLHLPYGFEYLVEAEGTSPSREISPTLRVGPAGKKAHAKVSLFPTMPTRVRLNLQVEEEDGPILSVESSLGTPLWRKCPRGKGNSFETIGDLIRIHLRKGYFFLRLPQIKTEVPKPLTIKIPPLVSLRVLDSKGAPIPQAEVYLLNPRGDHWKALRDSYWQTWFFGKTDKEGRIALPKKDWDGGQVRVGAFGFLPKTATLDRETPNLVLDPDRIQKIKCKLEDDSRAIFANGFSLGLRVAYQPHFVQGNFLVPHYLLGGTRKNRRDDHALGIRDRYGNHLRFWSPTGEQFDLGTGKEPGTIRTKSLGITISKGLEKGTFSWKTWDASAWNRKSRPSPLALCLPLRARKGKLILPLCRRPEVFFLSPNHMPHILDPTQPPSENSPKEKILSFSPQRGRPSSLRILGKDGKPLPGSRLEVFLLMNAQGTTPLRESQKEDYPAGMGYDFLPDLEGWIRLGISEGYHLNFAASAPGRSPFFGRLSPGEHKKIVLEEDEAWLWIHSSPRKTPLQIKPEAFRNKAQDKAVALRMSHFFPGFRRRSIPGKGGSQVLFGPLPAGDYQLKSSKSNHRKISLEAGEWKELNS